MRIWLVLAGMAAALTNAVEYPRSLDLPDDADVRSALQRISARTGVSLPRTSWPLLAREARQFLDDAVALDSGAITRSDSVILSDLVVGPKELYRWSGAGSSLLALNARASGTWTATDSGGGSNERMGWLGGRMYGVVGGDLWFFSDARIFTRWSDDYVYWDRYAMADGEPSGVPFDDPSVNGRYKSNTGARYTAWAQWTRDWITLKYGRDHIQYGPGLWTGLTTKYSTPPYQMLDARLSPFPWLTVQATVLEARVGEVAGGISFPGDDRKWMHVHRYEIRPAEGLSLAFQNQILYKDSGGVNPAYLLPLVPIFFSQDLSGNRDNSAMQFDFSYTSRWGAKAWGALMVDDLNSLTDIFGSHWLNRWAVLMGGQIVSPWKSFDADVAVEWSMVRPWSYTGGREEAYSFAHLGLPMGSELGPDSRTLHARLAWRPRNDLVTGFEFSTLEKGGGHQATLGVLHNPNGSDPGNSRLFLEGKSLCRLYAGDLGWIWKRQIELRGSLSRVQYRGAAGFWKSGVRASMDW